MKETVDRITSTAMVGLLVGSTMLDSPNLLLPMTIIIPSLAWIMARVIITGVCR